MRVEISAFVMQHTKTVPADKLLKWFFVSETLIWEYFSSIIIMSHIATLSSTITEDFSSVT